MGGWQPFPPEDKAILGFPMHPYSQCIIDKEWASPAKYKEPGRPSSQLYALVPELIEHFKNSLVNAPVDALGAPSALPADTDDLPKDPNNRRVEVFANCAFHAFSEALRGSTASLGLRAIMIWTKQF